MNTSPFGFPPNDFDRRFEADKLAFERTASRIKIALITLMVSSVVVIVVGLAVGFHFIQKFW